MDIFRTLIVTADTVGLSREVAASFGPGGVGMWTTPLSSTGSEPATHYISSGFIPAEFAFMVPYQEWQLNDEGSWQLINTEPGDSVAVYNAASEAGIDCTQEQIDAIYNSADVTSQEPFVAMNRLGLSIVNPPNINT